MIYEKCRTCTRYITDVFGELSCGHKTDTGVPPIGLPCYRSKRDELVDIKSTDNQQYKFDAGKLRLDLVTPSFIKAVGAVRTYGVNKYGDNDGWKHVEINRYIGAAMRHFEAYRDGEYYDSESGLPHLWHVACNIMFLVVLESEKGELKNE